MSTPKPSDTELRHAHWFVSSHSGNNGTCVEVAALPGRVAARDSKNRTGGHLLVTRHTFATFTHAAATGQI